MHHLLRLWPRLERILDDVLDLREPDRFARALAACEGDPSLERAVNALLRADVDAGSFLYSLPPDLLGTDEAEPDEPPEISRIGPFRVVRRIGSGGMGSVLLGERDDGQFEQTVAIKVLGGAVAAGAARETLLRERRILARLEHPGIARMYDGGVTADLDPYFVMEYVDGLPLDRYCDARRLGVEERLLLFVQICGAVEYAHSRLVVHCDLKPGNILVTASGGVKLLDFGISRLLAEESQAAPGKGGLLLTPAYAAPEQIRGEPATASTDVYQLGLVLYELLTGRRARSAGSGLVRETGAHVAGWEPEVPSRKVQESAVQRLSLTSSEIAALRGTSQAALSRRLAGDLDAIVSEALRNDPAKRYPSVEALRRDVEDCLASRPVAARHGTGAYRLGKYLARHRLGASAAGGIVLSLVGGLVAVTAQSRVVAHERDRATAAESRASAVNEFVVHELLRAPMPEASMGRELTVGEVLANAARSVGHAFHDQPGTEAQVRLALARTYAALGRSKDAEVHARAASNLLSRAPEAPPAALEEAERTLADIANDNGHYAEARSQLEALRRRQIESRGADDPETLETTVALARSLNSLGEFAQAEAMLREALAVTRRRHPDRWRLEIEIERQLSRALTIQFQSSEGEALARSMLATLEEHLGPDHPESITARTVLADSLTYEFRYVEAAEVTAEAVALSRKIFGNDHPSTAEALYSHALALSRLKGYKEALVAAREVLAIRERALGLEHPSTIFALYAVGILTKDAGRLDEAEKILRDVVDRRARTLGETHGETILALESLSRVLVAQKQERDAREIVERIIRDYDRTVRRPDAEPDLIIRFARFLLDVEPMALQDVGRSQALAARAVEATGRRSYLALRILGDTLARSGEKDRAVEIYREALRLPDGMRSWSTEERVVNLLAATPDRVEQFLRERIEQQHDPRADERMLAKSMRLLAIHLQDQKRFPEAERWFDEALERFRRKLPADNWELGRVESELGGCLAAAGAFARAEPRLLEGYEIVAKDSQARLTAAEARQRLVELYESWGRPREAERWRRAKPEAP